MKIEIRFTSDWQIGSGTGIPGSVDSLVVRDPDGMPFVPAKSLTGMLRDGCELVARHLAPHLAEPENPWLADVETLFGTQAHNESCRRVRARPAILSIRPARLPAELRRILGASGAGALRDALTFVAPHVAIDPASGRADPHKLFFVEVVRAGARLESELRVLAPASLTEHQCALLDAGARAVRGIGGRRRRGLGECEVTLHELPPPPAGQQDWLGWLEQQAAARPAQAAPSLEPSVPTDPHDSKGNTCAALPDRRPPAPAPALWAVFPYEILALSPLCIPARTTGNQVESLGFVPGTLLLPLVHQALEQAGLDPAPRIREARVVVTHAYPVQEDRSSSWPVPLALHRLKEGQGLDDPQERVRNGLHETAEGQVQWKQLRRGYVTAELPGGERPTLVPELRSLHLHNTVDDERQRPTEEVGGVYGYQAIPVGTRLKGEIRIADPASPQTLLTRLQEAGRHYALGRAKKDDFGQVRVTFPLVRSEGPGTAKDGAVKPQPEGSAGASGTGLLTVWLLSDLLLRDEYLAWDTHPEALVRALESELGVGLSLAGGAPAVPGGSTPGTEPDRQTPAVFARAHRLEGWIRNWDLPRPTLCGLSGGSCFLLQVDPADRSSLQQQTLDALHLRGLGERRAEGFGQLRIDAGLLAGPVASAQPRRTIEPPPEAEEQALQGAAPDDFAELLEQEAWKRAIREAATRLAYGPKEPLAISRAAGGRPSASQLGALRTVFAALDGGEQSRKAASDWLQRLRDTPSRRERWPAPTLVWLEKLLDPAGSEVWKLLFPEEEGARLPATLVPGTSALLCRKLGEFAVGTLIVTLCAAVFDLRAREPNGKEVVHGTAN